MTPPGADTAGAQSWRTRTVARAGSLVLTALLRSARIRISGYERYAPLARARQPVVFLLWHGRLLPCTYSRRGEGIAALISQHRDGEYISRIVRGWGFEPVRGSSTRGGSGAMRKLVRHIQGGRSVAITPDGPRGPRQKMKTGALLVAQLSGAPIVPVSAGAGRAWWFGGWDRFLVPQPFAPVHVVYGEPVYVPRELDSAELAAYTQRVEDALNDVTRYADEE